MDQNITLAEAVADSERETEGQAIVRLRAYAEEHFDGHFTLLKFTTNWRCMLGTVSPQRPAIQRMPCGHSLSEAVSRAIRHAEKRR